MGSETATIITAITTFTIITSTATGIKKYYLSVGQIYLYDNPLLVASTRRTSTC